MGSRSNYLVSIFIFNERDKRINLLIRDARMRETSRRANIVRK